MTGRELDPEVKEQLRTLGRENAEVVGRHLVMVGRLLADDLDAAQAHAEAAVRRAGRVAAVREARGLVAYRRGDWATALSEFRTVRRLSGSTHLLPLMVDAERGLGRLDRALDLAAAPESRSLSPQDQVELAIVVSGIRRDLGQLEEAALGLRAGALRPGQRHAWSARLYYAYAEAQLALGQVEDARRWFAEAVDADADATTDAADRLDELDGLVMTDLLDEDEDESRGHAAAGHTGPAKAVEDAAGAQEPADVDRTPSQI